jgi:hypothetical protein
VAAIDDRSPIRRSRDIGVYLGLVPKRYQSGEVDHTWRHLEMRGQAGANTPVRGRQRHADRYKGQLKLKDWAYAITKRLTMRKAIPARRVENNQGPVVVVVEYRVDANDRAEFLSAVDELGYARKRDGAYAWGVYEDVADGGRFIETFSIESWLEVLHQRERVTNADEMLRSRVRQLLKEAPRITLGVSPERPHRHWQKRAGDPRP